MNLEKAKALFRAQYLNQPVLRFDDRPNETFKVLAYDCTTGSDTGYLLLRSVKQIKDEEIHNIGDINKLYSNGFKRSTKNIIIGNLYSDMLISYAGKVFKPNCEHILETYDYLRSIGILLPFTFLDEENKPITLPEAEIIKLGWAVIKED